MVIERITPDPGSRAVRVLLSGDTHGNLQRVADLLEVARQEGCPTAVVVGDFGYWEHTRAGRRFLNGADRAARRRGVRLVFLDGNHDNHPLLWEKYCGPGAKRSTEGFVQVRRSVFYIERGARWRWGTRDFLAMGGAPSADKEWRLAQEAGVPDRSGRWRGGRGAGTLWWPTEEVTDEDLARAGSAPADVVLSHDAPSGFSVPARKDHPGADAHRDQIRTLVERTGAGLVVHGHHHLRRDERAGALRVVGLGHDGGELVDSLAVLEV